MFVNGIQLEDRVSIYDIERVYKYASAAKEIKIQGWFSILRTNLASLKYLKCILAILTKKKKWWSFNFVKIARILNDVIEKQGLLKKDKNPVKDEKKPLEIIDYYVTWLAVRMNTAKQVIKEQTAVDDIQGLFNEILIRDSDTIKGNAFAYHKPDKAIKNFFDDVTSRIKKLNFKLLKGGKQESNVPLFFNMKKSLDKAFTQ